MVQVFGGYRHIVVTFWGQRAKTICANILVVFLGSGPYRFLLLDLLLEIGPPPEFAVQFLAAHAFYKCFVGIDLDGFSEDFGGRALAFCRGTFILWAPCLC